MFRRSHSLTGAVFARLAIGGLSIVAGCSSGPNSSAAAPSSAGPLVAAPGFKASLAAPSVSAPRPSTPSTSLAVTDTGSSLSTSKNAASPTSAAFAEACTSQALLAYVRTQPSMPPTGFKEVKIYNCVNGFARIYAVPNPDANGSHVTGEQFFLQFTNGKWSTLDHGVAIDCGDNDPKLVAACAAFA